MKNHGEKEYEKNIYFLSKTISRNIMMGRKHSKYSFWNYSGMKGAVQGVCLSPPYDVHKQGPLEKVTGGKTQGKRHRVCQRVETGSTHKPKDMERWTVKGWKKSILKRAGETVISDKINWWKKKCDEINIV